MTKRMVATLGGLLLFSAAGCAADGAGEDFDHDAPPARPALPATPEEAVDLGSTAQSLAWTNCSAGDSFYLGLVWGQARQIAERSAAVYAQDPNHYDVQLWFGWPTDPHIGNVLRGVRDDLISEDIHVICDDGHASCTGNIARAQGYNDVRICAAFWGLEFWEQVGVFLHEVAHHNGAPLDACYGPQACYDLARTDPATARQTGGSYEEFYYSMWWW